MSKAERDGSESPMYCEGGWHNLAISKRWITGTRACGAVRRSIPEGRRQGRPVAVVNFD